MTDRTNSYTAKELLDELESGAYALHLGTTYPERYDPEGAMKLIVEALRAFDGPSHDEVVEMCARVADREWIGENSLVGSRLAGAIARAIRSLKQGDATKDAQ